MNSREDGFLSRWAKRKADVRETEARETEERDAELATQAGQDSKLEIGYVPWGHEFHKCTPLIEPERINPDLSCPGKLKAEERIDKVAPAVLLDRISYEDP